MTDTTIIAGNVEAGSRSAFTWSVVIAGALAAWAVAFIFISLGSGIGFGIASPYYSGPSTTAMSIGGAIWLVFSQTCAYAVAGYMAARLRVRDHIPGPETKFRDAAHGFMAWVVGVGLMTAAIFLAAVFTPHVTGNTAVVDTDAARQAAAYVAFWSFMALLFGAVAATLAGILGGELRDEG